MHDVTSPEPDRPGASSSPRRMVRARILGAIAEGTLGEGALLPSVRDLSNELGVAPMTVSKVYGDLKDEGRIEGRPGAGTFVAASKLAGLDARDRAGLWRAVDEIIDRGARAGLDVEDMAALVAARMGMPRDHMRRIVMVGRFVGATESYARDVAEILGRSTGVTAVTLGAGDAAPGEEARALIGAADVILSFEALVPRIAAMAPAAPVVPLRFIPSGGTRRALASIDPQARVALVSLFADYLPVLEQGVRRFAPHVETLESGDMETGGVEALVAGCDVCVFSTGAAAAAEFLPEGAEGIEFRNAPARGDVLRLVRPLLVGPGT